MKLWVSILGFFFLMYSPYLCIIDFFWNSNNCRTSIADLHRSCLQCSYELCLNCCQEIREGNLKGQSKVIWNYPFRGKDYMHGGDPLPIKFGGIENSKNPTMDRLKYSFEWKSTSNGDIPCPPNEIGGCSNCRLELKRIFHENWVSELVKKVEEAAHCYHLPQVSTTFSQCMCSKMNDDNMLRKVASREISDDNYLYCPTSRDIQQEGLEHFQRHWIRGEPVIVRNVLEHTSGLSWEPMVMWRALRGRMNSKNVSKLLEVKAIDCLAWCEVSCL